MSWDTRTKMMAPLVLSAFLGACASAPPKAGPDADVKPEAVLQPSGPSPAQIRAQQREFAETVALLRNPNLSKEDTATLSGFLMLKYYAVGDTVTKGILIDIAQANHMSIQDLEATAGINEHIKSKVQEAVKGTPKVRKQAIEELSQIYTGERYKAYPFFDMGIRRVLKDEMARGGLEPEALNIGSQVHCLYVTHPDNTRTLECN